MDAVDFDTIRKILENKSLILWKHENRGFAKMGLDESNFHEFNLSGRRFFIITTPVFRQILTSVLAEAAEKYPDCFGTGNTSDVLRALYKIEAVGTLTEFQDFLNVEQFAWIVEINNGHVNTKILKVELFRKIDPIKGDEAKNEFTGGAFHSFKHFNYKGVALSTKKEKKDIDHPNSILHLLISGFFFSELKSKDTKGEKFESMFTFEMAPSIAVRFT